MVIRYKLNVCNTSEICNVLHLAMDWQPACSAEPICHWLYIAMWIDLLENDHFFKNKIQNFVKIIKWLTAPPNASIILKARSNKDSNRTIT